MVKRESRADPGREAWELLFQLLPGIRSNMVAVWNELDLTPAQGRLLQYLDPANPVAMTDLADQHCCDASNITGLVDKLEARRLIERTADPGDRRVKMIAVTRSGAALRARLLERLGEPPAFIRSLSAADQQTLRDLLHKATRAID